MTLSGFLSELQDHLARRHGTMPAGAPQQLRRPSLPAAPLGRQRRTALPPQARAALHPQRAAQR